MTDEQASWIQTEAACDQGVTTPKETIVDFNRMSGSESDPENNFHSEKLDGGTESEFRGLISQFQEFGKVSFKQKQTKQNSLFCNFVCCRPFGIGGS